MFSCNLPTYSSLKIKWRLHFDPSYHPLSFSLDTFTSESIVVCLNNLNQNYISKFYMEFMDNIYSLTIIKYKKDSKWQKRIGPEHLICNKWIWIVHIYRYLIPTCNLGKKIYGIRYFLLIILASLNKAGEESVTSKKCGMNSLRVS